MGGIGEAFEEAAAFTFGGEGPSSRRETQAKRTALFRERAAAEQEVEETNLQRFRSAVERSLAAQQSTGTDFLQPARSPAATTNRDKLPANRTERLGSPEKDFLGL